MAIHQPARPGRRVLIIWMRRRVHQGDDIPKRHNVAAASQGRHGRKGGRRNREEEQPEENAMGDPIPSSPGRPQGEDEDDDLEIDEGCESEASSASEYDADLFEPAEPPPPPLDAAFAPVVQSLADEALGRFFSLSSAASSSSFCQSPRHPQPHDAPPRTPTTIPTYTCPYYVRDPAAYAPCQPGGSASHCFFPRLLDLRRHLQTAHRRPPWCPACGACFARAATRDAHLRALACSADAAPAAPPPPPPGLTEPQLRRLARRPDPAVPAPQQWVALWRLCFGDEYGAGGASTRAVAPGAAAAGAACAFWARHRRALAVDTPGRPAAATLAATTAGRAALEAAVLGRMLETLLRDARPGSGEATGADRGP